MFDFCAFQSYAVRKLAYMLFKIKKIENFLKHNQQWFLINLAALVGVVFILLLIDNLWPGIHLENNSKANKASFNTKVLASSLPNFSLSGNVQSCSQVIFSWQPVATLPVTIKAAESQDFNKIVFARDYDIGATLAIWPKAKGNTNYWVALSVGDRVVSNQITVTTPAC